MYAYPTAEIKGCYYHYCQCLNRKIQQIGLQAAYREDADLNRFVRRTAALAFVPPRYVRLAWQAVKLQAPTLPRVEEFVEYFEQTWLVGNYHLSHWNVLESASVRTNNHVEGWHNRLKKVVGKAHPISSRSWRPSRRSRLPLKCPLHSWLQGLHHPGDDEESSREIAKSMN